MPNDLRVVPYNARWAPEAERNWGADPAIIQIHTDRYGWDNYLTLGNELLKKLHSELGAYLAKKALDAQAQR